MLVSWKPPSSDGGAPVEGYWLEMKDNEMSRWKKLSKSLIMKSGDVSSFFRVSFKM